MSQGGPQDFKILGPPPPPIILWVIWEWGSSLRGPLTAVRLHKQLRSVCHRYSLPLCS